MVPPDKLQRPFGPAGDGNNIIEHLAGLDDHMMAVAAYWAAVAAKPSEWITREDAHFTDVLWPAFRKVDFLRAIRAYQARSRRFGR